MAQEWEINLSPKFHLFMTQTNGKAGLESMAMWRGVSFWLAFPLSNWRVGWELFLIVKAKSTTVVGKHIWTRCWQSLYLNVGWEEDSTLDNNSVYNSWVRGGGSFFFTYSFSFLLFFLLDDIIFIGTNKDKWVHRDYLCLKGSISGCVFWVEVLQDKLKKKSVNLVQVCTLLLTCCGVLGSHLTSQILSRQPIAWR